jgi:hypothetical protein
MTINRQNGCFVPFYSMVVSPSSITTDGDPGLRIESFAVINLRGHKQQYYNDHIDNMWNDMWDDIIEDIIRFLVPLHCLTNFSSNIVIAGYVFFLSYFSWGF